MAEKPFVATEDIFSVYNPMVLAYAKGDAVPAENVELNKWQDKVSREGTKAAVVARTEG